MSSLTSRLLLCTLLAVLLLSPSALAADWYVSPSGNSGNNGSIGSPWDLQTALDHPGSVQAGDTIWLRNGTYTGLFGSYLDGTSANPIKVRSYTGEWAVISGSTNSTRTPAIHVYGTYTWFMDFEMKAAGSDRISAQSTSWPDDLDYSYGIEAGNNAGEGIGCKMINLVIHDTAQAVSLWVAATNAEATGCLLYHNGWDAPDRGHGHAIYTQNDTSGRKLYRDNIAWGGFATGGHAYGSASQVCNFTFEDNTFFDSGINSNVAGGYNLLIGGGDGNSSGIIATGNVFFRRDGDGQMRNGFKLGYGGVNIDANVQYNYGVGCYEIFSWQTLHIRHNTIIGPRELLLPLCTNSIGSWPSYDWDYNTYHCTETSDAWGHWQPFVYQYNTGNPGVYTTWTNWRANSIYDDNSSYSTSYPTSLVTFVSPSPYQDGYGSITFYNWADSNSIDVDISSIIDSNQSYVIKDAQNFFGAALASGTYTGGTVSVPVNGTTAVQPAGNAPLSYTHTPKTFGVLIVRPTSGGGGSPPSAPTGLTASDGTYTDKVALDWADTSGATSYKVFRNTTNNSGAASQIGTPSASAYDDTTATAGTTYYYWVKATNGYGDSNFSSYDTGDRAVGPPPTPTGLAASDGTYTDKVALDWADSSGATSYKVYRNTTNNSGSASQIGTPSASAYDDTTATAGTTYYFWVKATNASGDSNFSTMDTGYRLAAPGTPTGLTASDGTYTDKVALDWADTSGATSYKVYRNTTNNSGTATQIGTPSASAYDDTTATAGTTYYYWVKASNAAGDSGFSSSDSGSRSVGSPPSAPTGLTASDGTYTDKVALDWADTSGATSYKVFRNTTNNSGTASQIGTPTTSAYDDTTATAGTTYYYWVKATNGAGDSGFSSSDTGYRSAGLAAPTNLTASDGTVSKVYLNWDDVGGATSYYIYRNTTNNSGTATQISTQASSYFEDTTGAANTTYYYWVKAHNGSGDSAFSTPDTGWRAGIPGTPTGLTASDGTYTTKVALDWADTTGATSYKVYRNTINNSGQATQIGTPTDSAFDDTTATASTTYYYWVKAHNAAGDSSTFSTTNTGWRAP